MTEEIKVMPYFMVYASDFKTLKDKLTEKEIVEMLDAISDLCLYAETDFEPKTKFQKIWFQKLKDDFLKNFGKYKTCIENGRKGGRPPKNPTQNPIETQTKPIGYLWDKPKQNPDETNKIKENKIKENKKEENIKEDYINKPTKKQLEDYCSIQGIVGVNLDDFYNYYEAADWWDELRNRPINWKQKLVSWKMNQKSTPPKPEEKPYYTEA